MTVQAFIDEISRRLRDDNPDKDCRQWDEGFLINALNASFGALCHVKPDAFTVCRDITLVEGHAQTIDPDLHRIIEILYNVCPTTGVAKRAITKVDRSVLDTAYPHWRQDAPRGYVRHYMRNDITQSKFDIWPPAENGRGPEPVEPAVLPDPGPVQTEFPDSVNPYTPRQVVLTRDTDYIANGGFTVGNDNYWDFEATDGLGEINFGDMIVIDCSNFVDVNGSTFRIFGQANSTLFNPGGLGGINQVPLRNFDFYDEINLSNIASTTLLLEDIEAAVAAGTPFIAYNIGLEGSGGQMTAMSGWMASADDLPDSYLTNPSNLTNTSSSETRVIPGSTGNPVGSVQTQAFNDTLTGLNSYSYVNIRPSAGMNENNTTSFTSFDGTLTWDVDWGEYQAQQSTESTYSLAFSAPGTFQIGRQAEPGVPGEIKYIRQPGRYAYHVAPISLRNATADPTTQEEVDAYLASVAAFDAWVIAHAAWTVATQAGIVHGEFTKTPCVLTEEPAERLEGDVLITEAMPFDKAYFLPLSEFALYYAYAVDDDVTANSGRAQRHWLAFFQLMNKREDADLIVEATQEKSE